MTCRSCGIEIADKALICYRCGTATTEATFKPAAITRRSPWSLIVSVVAIVLLAVMALYFRQTETGATSRLFNWFAVSAAVLVVAIRAYLRRRHR